MSPFELMARASVPVEPGTSMDAKSRAEAGCDTSNPRHVSIGRRESSPGDFIGVTLLWAVLRLSMTCRMSSNHKAFFGLGIVKGRRRAAAARMEQIYPKGEFGFPAPYTREWFKAVESAWTAEPRTSVSSGCALPVIHDKYLSREKDSPEALGGALDAKTLQSLDALSVPLGGVPA